MESLPRSAPQSCGYLLKTCVWAEWRLATWAHGEKRRMKRKNRRDGTNERKAWKVERGVWRVVLWAWSPEEAERRGQTGNERGDERKETDRVRANGMNLKEARTNDQG